MVGRAITAGIVLISLVIFGWIFWLNNHNPISYDLISYHVDSNNQVTVQLQVSKPADIVVNCVVVAEDFYSDIVGQENVLFPTGKTTASVSQVIPTESRAVLGNVSSCSKVG
jgi:Domain of unknown function (DUF4307)